MKRINIISNKEFPGDRLQDLIDMVSKRIEAVKTKNIYYSEERFRENANLGHEHAAIYHLKNVIKLRIKKIIMDHCEE